MNATEWLTLALVVITGFYAWATLRILRVNEAMVSTMKDQQDAAMRPYLEVSMNVRTGTNILRLSIKNVGKTPALSLRLLLDRDFYQFCEKRPGSNLAEHPAFSNTIESFPPGSELLFDLGSGPTLYSSANNESLSPLVFSVTASYVAGKVSISEKSVVDLNPYIHTSIPTEPIVEELAKLRQEFSSMKKSLAADSLAVELSKLREQLVNGSVGISPKS